VTLTQFILAVDNLVKSWALDEPDYRVVPRDALRAIWEQVREDAVYELAESERLRDQAMAKLHKHYLEESKPKEKK